MKVLKGIRVLSLALNLPGPAALMRLQAMGAVCEKIEPPAGDLMQGYSRQAYADMHAGIQISKVDLKSEAGQKKLAKKLQRCDVLVTSFRPSALVNLGLGWLDLHKRHPKLSLVSIVGAPGAAAELPGHDLTYQAAFGLVNTLDLPPSLLSDMGGALACSEAVLQAVLHHRKKGRGCSQEVALSQAAQWLALPKTWGLTAKGALLGGGHAGYRLYPCRDGRVAVAALEPHFAKALCALAGIAYTDPRSMMLGTLHQKLARFFLPMSCKALEALAIEHDLPLLTLPNKPSFSEA
jgi:alpha-methylacyl-CoA racemase